MATTTWGTRRVSPLSPTAPGSPLQPTLRRRPGSSRLGEPTQHIGRSVHRHRQAVLGIDRQMNLAQLSPPSTSRLDSGDRCRIDLSPQQSLNLVTVLRATRGLISDLRTTWPCCARTTTARRPTRGGSSSATGRATRTRSGPSRPSPPSARNPTSDWTGPTSTGHRRPRPGSDGASRARRPLRAGCGRTRWWPPSPHRVRSTSSIRAGCPHGSGPGSFWRVRRPAAV